MASRNHLVVVYATRTDGNFLKTKIDYVFAHKGVGRKIEVLAYGGFQPHGLHGFRLYTYT